MDGDLRNMTHSACEGEVMRLRNAIRLHRDVKRHDRCWINDYELYSVLPEGVAEADLKLPPKDEFITNCEEYWFKRQPVVKSIPKYDFGQDKE